MEERDDITLLVRHLPDGLPPQTLKRLFSHYGASDVRCCLTGRLKGCAFINFSDEALAARAQSQLHRLRFLGKTLTVERARPAKDDNKKSVLLPKLPLETSGPSSAPESIAAALGVGYPFPPHLEYVYPPPDGNILNNIVNALIAVPKFYTQVLHLMNKMNLPAPFSSVRPTPPLPRSAQVRTHPADLASDESELESSEEEDGEGKSRKRRRKEVILGPAEAAGVKTVVDPSRAIPSKQPVLQIKIVPKAEGKSKFDEKADNVEEHRHFATREELDKGKLSLAEVAGHPVFKNYIRGTPSSVLYIKNLEKDVVPEDLYYVFRGFLPSSETELNIKLMQEGRMKGQAFVTFPTVELAQDALAGVHSFVLKGKPMVIQFGRK